MLWGLRVSCVMLCEVCELRCVVNAVVRRYSGTSYRQMVAV